MEFLRPGLDMLRQGVRDLFDFIAGVFEEHGGHPGEAFVEKVFGDWGWHAIVWRLFIVGLAFLGTYIVFHKVTLLYLACMVLGWLVAVQLFQTFFSE